MKWDEDTIMLILNIITTVFSGIGAYKSFKYFNKSKHITIYAQTNKTLNEIGEMLKILPEILSAISVDRKGRNSELTVQKMGTELAAHMNEIMSSVPTDYMGEFIKLQSNPTFDLSKYINSLIDGTGIIKENGRKTLKRDTFDACQERLREMQAFLKKKFVEEEEKLR